MHRRSCALFDSCGSWVPAFAGMTAFSERLLSILTAIARRQGQFAAEQIFPVGIERVDQVKLLRAAPFLDALLAVNGDVYIIICLEPHQPVHAVARSESLNCIVSMLMCALEEIVRNACVHGAVAPAGHDVNVVLARPGHGCNVTNPPRQPLPQLSQDLRLRICVTQKYLSSPRMGDPAPASFEHGRLRSCVLFNSCRGWVPAYAGMTVCYW